MLLEHFYWIFQSKYSINYRKRLQLSPWMFSCQRLSFSMENLFCSAQYVFKISNTLIKTIKQKKQVTAWLLKLTSSHDMACHQYQEEARGEFFWTKTPRKAFPIMLNHIIHTAKECNLIIECHLLCYKWKAVSDIIVDTLEFLLGWVWAKKDNWSILNSFLQKKNFSAELWPRYLKNKTFLVPIWTEELPHSLLFCLFYS